MFPESIKLMDDEIALCPFCGGEGLETKDIRDGFEQDQNDTDAWAYYIVCRACAAQGGWSKNKAGAVRFWNSRIISEQTTLMIIALLEDEIKSLENDIPTRHGGDFAKKYATNALRAFAGRLRSLALEEDDF